MTLKTFTLGLITAVALSGPVMADKLDDIIASGKLRCAVVLDFKPMGSRDAQNNPVGFDVDYCNDLAKALGVKAQIVETPFPERIPALMSNRVDVGVASTSDTLERAKTVGMSVPYFAFEMVVAANAKAGIASFEELKGKVVGAPAGTFEAIAMEKQIKAWGKGEFRPYQTQADVYLALSQGQIDATITPVTSIQETIRSGKFPGIAVVGKAPFDIDYASLFTNREEYGLLNFLNLFINQQVRTGRYAELYKKWIGTEPPVLTISGVYR